MTTNAEQQEIVKARRWAEVLSLGLLIGEKVEELEGADGVQIVDANGNVLFNIPLKGEGRCASSASRRARSK